MTTTLIRNANIVNEGTIFKGSVLIKGEEISDIFDAGQEPHNLSPTYTIDAAGKYLLPGAIDDQVHFRQPGLTHKGDLHTESLAAVAGGITSFMEMPNTQPQTVTQDLLSYKYELGEKFSVANYSFFFGATNNNLSEIVKTDPKKVCGVKIFMGSSTGNMLVDDIKTLEGIFKESPTLIAVHCEDEPTIKANLQKYKEQFGDDIPMKYHPVIRDSEACYRSSAKAVEMATKFNSQLHILHLSSAKETSLFSNTIPLKDKKITAEVCIHHLWFSDKDYEKYGSHIKWNPAIKAESDRMELWKSLLNNKIDVIATDHAPHTLQEKENLYTSAPSGGPLVQHAMVAMVEFHKKGLISLENIAEKMSHAPSVLFRISKRGFIRKGYFADLVILDLDAAWTVRKENIVYKCGWSPFEGTGFSSSVTHTFVNGRLVYENGRLDDRYRGKRLEFER